MKTLTKERLAELDAIANTSGLNRNELRELQDHAEATIGMPALWTVRQVSKAPSRAEIAMRLMAGFMSADRIHDISSDAWDEMVSNTAKVSVKAADALLNLLNAKP